MTDNNKFVFVKKEMREVETIIRPSDVYGPEGFALVQKTMDAGWYIAAFREPLKGEVALFPYGIDTTRSDTFSPRFLLVRLSTQQLSEVWS
jgi:hypothetical protein